MIVVAGPPACGKTTFATALARRLGFALFDLDQVTGSLSAAALSLLGKAEHAFDEEGAGKQLRDARYASLVDAARANMSIGWGVVLAAPFTREMAEPAAWGNLVDRLAVDRLAPAAPGSSTRSQAVALVYLDCPAPVILRRLRSRGAARDHLKLASPQAARRLGAQAPPKVPHLALDGTLATPAQVDRALLGLGLSGEVPAPAGAGAPSAALVPGGTP
ncbi:MAG TPA: AAA family ATPase [Acidimicrobiales bacterium]|nr:AAA family ATPase [Acidimicrobiales bacterium]